MILFRRCLGGALRLAAGAALPIAPASAQQPVPWQTGFQAPGGGRMAEIIQLHFALMWIVVPIGLAVAGLIVIAMVRFNARANPSPAPPARRPLIAVAAWVALMAIVVAGIPFLSLPVLYRQAAIPGADLTVVAIGKQWYWTYEYPDYGNLTFDAVMLDEAQAGPAGAGTDPRLLGASNRVVVPVNSTVHVVATAADVIHAWAIPALGVKVDAVPGRINETWFRPQRQGVYYGQCSELCGTRHAYMPIAVEVVSQTRFDSWVAESLAQ